VPVPAETGAVRPAVYAALALLFAGTAGAQDGTDDASDAAELIRESARAYIPARAVKRPPPSYPHTELSRGREAWVELSYCIDESGKPQNIVVVDSAGSNNFERAAVDAVRNWRFEPAFVDGQPSWQSNNLQLVTFAIDDGTMGGSRRTRTQFRELRRLIDEHKLPEADELFQELIGSNRLNLYELGKIWAQRVRYEALAGDLYTLDVALHRASASNGQWMEQEHYFQMLAFRIKVELQLGNYATAISAFARLEEVAGEDDPGVVELQPTMVKVHELIASDAILKTPAEVRARGGCYGCNDSYWFRPARRKFMFADVDGELQSVEMRCDHRRFEAPVSDLVEWHIPESWGTCFVEVYGKPGTTFNVLTLPDNWEG
jgi:TonB family protein